MKLRRGYTPDPVVKERLLRRLRRSTPYELERWTDQIMTGISVNLREMQKSLSRSDTEQTLSYVADTKQGALSLLAAMHVMEENLTIVRSR